MITAGIDYSMTSPAICIHEGPAWSLDNCKFFFRSDKKSLKSSKPSVTMSLIQEYKLQEERFYNNALWARRVLDEYKVTEVVLEGYAMGAKGLVFHIGESTGILKHFLWRDEIKIHVVPPMVIKKFATGKGNANKDAMEEAFKKETDFDMRAATTQSPKINTPSSDLIDSYYMCKYSFHFNNLTPAVKSTT